MQSATVQSHPFSLQPLAVIKHTHVYMSKRRSAKSTHDESTSADACNTCQHQSSINEELCGHAMISEWKAYHTPASERTRAASALVAAMSRLELTLASLTPASRASMRRSPCSPLSCRSALPFRCDSIPVCHRKVSDSIA